MILEPGAAKICVLQDMQICDLRLDGLLFLDLRKAVPALSIESLAYDLLKGLMTRETLSRGINTDRIHCGRTAYLVVHVLLNRQTQIVRNMRSSDYRLMTDDENERILNLLDRYGVSCAKEYCCKIRKGD